MTSIREIEAKDVLEENPVSVNVGQTLSKVRARMEDKDLRTIPVVDGKKFVGMLGYRELMEKVRSDPSSTKVESLVHQPPEIGENHNLVKLSDIRINSGRKKFALLDKHDRLQGIIGERDMVFPAKDAEELKNVNVEDLMTNDLITVREDESHETARKKMREKNISRLPVLDDAGELVGIITSNDLLRAMVPREQMADGDYKHHKESLSDIPVSELLQDDVAYESLVLEDASTTIPEAIDTLSRKNQRELVVTANDQPIGILTLKDVLDHIADHEEVENLRVELTGPEVPEEKEVILNKVETAVRGSLGRILRRPEELKIHVKKYEKDGTRHKYSLNFKLSSTLGVTTVKTHDWDLLNAVDEGLDELETVVKKEQEKRRDERRDEERKGKYS